MLTQTLTLLLGQATEQTDPPVPAQSPLVDPCLVCFLVVQRHDTFDTLPLAFPRRDTEPTLHLRAGKELVEESNASSWGGRNGMSMRREVVHLV